AGLPGECFEQLVHLGVGELPARSFAAGGPAGDPVEVGQPAQLLHPVVAVPQRGSGIGLLPTSPEAAVEQQLTDTEPAALPGVHRGSRPAGVRPRSSPAEVRVRLRVCWTPAVGQISHRDLPFGQSLTAPATTPAAT